MHNDHPFHAMKPRKVTEFTNISHQIGNGKTVCVTFVTVYTMDSIVVACDTCIDTKPFDNFCYFRTRLMDTFLLIRIHNNSIIVLGC